MKHISAQAFQQTLAAEASNPSVAFINVCTPDEYRAKHIAGVKNIPLSDIGARVGELRDKRTIYVHCRSGNRSQKAIAELTALGVTAELVNVDGGLMAWEAAGLHTASTSSTLPITQQVFIAAGSLVLLGVLGALFVSTWWLALSAFVACGLLFAGLTGWCGMALLLSKMPWNKS